MVFHATLLLLLQKMIHSNIHYIQNSIFPQISISSVDFIKYTRM